MSKKQKGDEDILNEQLKEMKSIRVHGARTLFILVPASLLVIF